MHVRDEKSGLKNAIVLPLIILIPYLAFILLLEADYIFEVMRNGFVAWNF
jgi:cytochrome c oxidase subunit IV